MFLLYRNLFCNFANSSRICKTFLGLISCKCCNIVFFLYLLYLVFISPPCKCKYCHQKCCNHTNVINKKKVAPICTKLHEATSHSTKLHRVSPNCTKLHQDAPNCTSLHQVAPHCTNLYQTAPSCTTLDQVAPSCTKLRQGAQNYTNMH